MAKCSPLILICTFAFFSFAGAATISNNEFALRGVDSLAGSMAASLKSVPAAAIIVSKVEGRFGEALQNNLANALMRNGKTVYLSSEKPEGEKLLLQSTIHDYSLTYVGIGGGLFRQGQVAREFAISASARLLEPDGRLSQSFDSHAVTIADTLSFDAAKRARGGDTLLSPEMPSTSFQRIVEPGLIVGITGALVYLFFASR